MSSERSSSRKHPLLLSLHASSQLTRTFQILFYALRPTFVRSQKLTRWHATNLVVQLAFDFVLVNYTSRLVPAWFALHAARTVPSQTWIPLVYLIMSSFFAGSLHPLAGHFIAEHYLWDGLSQETYSYYGILNIFGYNVRLLRRSPFLLS